MNFKTNDSVHYFSNKLLRTLLALIAMLSVVFISLVILSGCAEKNHPVLRIGINPWLGYEPLYVARDLGYLDDNNIKLVDVSNASEVIRAFRNNVIEAAALTIDDALSIAKDDPDLRVILVMDYSDGADAIIARPEFKSLQELKDKRVGMETTAFSTYIFSRAVTKAGLDRADFKIVPLTVDRFQEAYENKQVDALVTFEPLKSKLEKQGANVVFDSSEIPGEIVDVLIVRREFLQNNSDQINDLLNAWFKARDEIQNNMHELAASISKREGLTELELTEAFNGLHILDKKENAEQLYSDPPMFLETVKSTNAIKKELGLFEDVIDIDDLIGIP